MKYFTGYCIWTWFLFLASVMYWYFTDKNAWGGPLVYVFLLVIHAIYYRSRISRTEEVCRCGHSKELHGASLMSWDEAQQRSRLSDTRYVDYHEGCQCLTYVPTLGRNLERKSA